MRAVLTLAATAAALSGSAAGTPFLQTHEASPPPINPENSHRELLKREITADAGSVNGKSFDFIIAGGGLAGLTLAARLSEWSNVTVLCIEAGGDGDDVLDRINVPGMSYINSLTKTQYDWKYQTVNQSNAGGVRKAWPRGKILGGSGAINGMFWGMGSEREYDDWGTLNPGSSWNWNEVHNYVKKSETVQYPPEDQAKQFHIVVDPASHGTSGPIHVGHSQFLYPVIENWAPTWQNLGFQNRDMLGGNVNGVAMSFSTLNTANMTRSDSKRGYIDPLPPRPNLRILTGQQVTKILFNGTTDAAGNKVASGVSFQAGPGAATYVAQANKEVILAGGTVGSPQILQLSGIGPADVITPFGIDSVVDLPVGHNLQEHNSFSMYFNTNPIDTWAVFASSDEQKAAALTEWRQKATGLWTYINEAVGYVSMKDIAGDQATSIANGLDLNQIASDVAARHNMPASVRSGLIKQYNLQKQRLADLTVGQLEIILTLWGNGANNLGIQCAFQHPFSRGTIMINNNDPFSSPTIDPDYYGVGVDAQIHRLGAEWVRRLAGTAPFKDIFTTESAPGAEVTGDALQAYITERAGTEYHPLGTCSMLPREDGGVVDTNLTVYGTSNLRVIDASIMPMQVSAHLMASTYGIAEKGADMIKAAHVWVPPVVANASVSATPVAPPVETTATIGDATDSAVTAAAQAAGKSSSLTDGAKIGIGVGVGLGGAALLGALLFFCCAAGKKRKRSSDEKGQYSLADNGAQGGAWDANAAYREQDSFAMGSLQPPGPRPISHASLSTMATGELPGQQYRDHPGAGGYSTPNFQNRQ